MAEAAGRSRALRSRPSKAASMSTLSPQPVRTPWWCAASTSRSDREPRHPAAYVRRDLTVEVLDQSYLRLPGDGPERRFAYEAPAFDFNADLAYDAAGLIIDYPGIASRAL